VFFGWLMNVVTFAQLSTGLIYEGVVFVGYGLPAFTFYTAHGH